MHMSHTHENSQDYYSILCFDGLFDLKFGTEDQMEKYIKKNKYLRFARFLKIIQTRYGHYDEHGEWVTGHKH